MMIALLALLFAWCLYWTLGWFSNLLIMHGSAASGRSGENSLTLNAIVAVSWAVFLALWRVFS